MRTLIIPDLLHHTENADYWLCSQSYDRAIFLGDYFDNFGNNVSDSRLSASWLRKRIETTDDVMLLGIHDAPYLFPNLDAMYCPGFTRAIREILQASTGHGSSWRTSSRAGCSVTPAFIPTGRKHRP